jgi:hypothetical protein
LRCIFLPLTPVVSAGVVIGRRVEGNTPPKKKFPQKVPKEAGQNRGFMGMLNESD